MGRYESELYILWGCSMNRKEKIIYCAGLLDGEGYVGIKKSLYIKSCPSPTYHERIQIRMIDEPAIKLFQSLFGGNYYKEKSHCSNGRPLYCYQASDKKASNICRILMPYLMIKDKNVKVLLKLRKNKESARTQRRGSSAKRRMPKDILEYRDKLWKQCKINNGIWGR